MSRRPPAPTKPMPTSSPSAIVIAMPPSRTNSPTNAAVDRLTFVLNAHVPLGSVNLQAVDVKGGCANAHLNRFDSGHGRGYIAARYAYRSAFHRAVPALTCRPSAVRHQLNS
jgi:hypothetical protein